MVPEAAHHGARHRFVLHCLSGYPETKTPGAGASQLISAGMVYDTAQVARRFCCV
jgi:hypothetical protein